MRHTGPSKKIRDLVNTRATVNGVPLCEVCGGLMPGGNIHHRQPKGMGGCPLPYINQPSNLLLVCGHGNVFKGCHYLIENNRNHARSMHWLVPRPLMPANIPVWYRGELVWLRDDGGVIPLDLAELTTWVGAA